MYNDLTCILNNINNKPLLNENIILIKFIKVFDEFPKISFIFDIGKYDKHFYFFKGFYRIRHNSILEVKNFRNKSNYDYIYNVKNKYSNWCYLKDFVEIYDYIKIESK